MSVSYENVFCTTNTGPLFLYTSVRLRSYSLCWIYIMMPKVTVFPVREGKFWTGKDDAAVSVSVSGESALLLLGQTWLVRSYERVAWCHSVLPVFCSFESSLRPSEVKWSVPVELGLPSFPATGQDCQFSIDILFTWSFRAAAGGNLVFKLSIRCWKEGMRSWTPCLSSGSVARIYIFHFLPADSVYAFGPRCWCCFWNAVHCE